MKRSDVGVDDLHLELESWLIHDDQPGARGMHAAADAMYSAHRGILLRLIEIYCGSPDSRGRAAPGGLAGQEPAEARHEPHS
jgi:hypothetical protein